MSIRYGLLALLDSGSKYGYQLRTEFESATGGSWPLNIGQVYTTLSRLERDSLVSGIGGEDERRVLYEITDEGRTELRRWFATPLARQARPRDELAIKLALALTVQGADVSKIVQTQRTATIRAMQDLTRQKWLADAGDLPWLLVVDSMIFQAEAEIRWLDHCESQLARNASRGHPSDRQSSDSTRDEPATTPTSRRDR